MSSWLMAWLPGTNRCRRTRTRRAAATTAGAPGPRVHMRTAIETALTVRMVYGLALRQTECLGTAIVSRSRTIGILCGFDLDPNSEPAQCSNQRIQ